MMERKNLRLKGYDYSKCGAYFLTIAVKNRHELLGRIVGSDDLGAPHVQLTKYGEAVKQYIDQIENHYEVTVDNYVIMPNHVHMLIFIKNSVEQRNSVPEGRNGCVARTHEDGVPEAGRVGVPGSSRPTMVVPNIVAAFKKMTSRGIGFNMWQTSYHDHIIRNDNDYKTHWNYIDANPSRWEQDEYFVRRKI